MMSILERKEMNELRARLDRLEADVLALKVESLAVDAFVAPLKKRKPGRPRNDEAALVG